MEAMALRQQQQLSGGCKPVDMAYNLEWGCSSQDSDVLMIDPFIDYVNGILMDEGVDDVHDAACLQEVSGASSYQAIFSSLQDIVADSGADDQLYKTAEASPPILQKVDGVSNYEAIFSSLQDLIADSATDNQVHETTGAPLHRNQSLPATAGHPQRNFLQDISSSKSTDRILHHNANKNAGRYNVRSCSNFKKDAATRHHHSAIQEENLDGVLLTDALVSCWGENHALVESLRGERGQGHDPAMSRLPSAHEQISLKVAELDLSFDDLKLDDVYSSLYVAEFSPLTLGAGRSGKHRIEDKRKSGAPRKGRSSEKHTSEVPVFGDVREVLMSCAQAVAAGDAKGTNKILQELHQVYGASAHGTGLQRMTYIFCQGLAARMRGTGAQEFEAMSRNMPSSAAVLRASKLEFEVSPYQKVVHYFANQSILKAAEGASRLHIVDYGIMNGLQWPCLINALADRKGDPPLLVITGIEFPQPGVDMGKKLEESGRRLAAYAKSHNVPFQFVGIDTDKWEDLDAASLQCSEAEVLVVNCVKKLRHYPDDTSTDLGSQAISPRQKLFNRMHSLKPQLLVTAFVNAAHNSPFFVTRFREALNFYSNVFDMLDALWGDIPERLIMEKSYFYRYMIAVIACEGAERVERPETYKQWHRRIIKAGFEQLPIPTTISERSKSHAKQHYHNDFLIHDDGKGWMLLGWKGRPTLGMSAWRPCHVG